MVEEYLTLTKTNDFFQQKRKEQHLYWLYETINAEIKTRFYADEAVKRQLKTLEQQVLEGTLSSFEAAKRMMDKYYR